MQCFWFFQYTLTMYTNTIIQRIKFVIRTNDNLPIISQGWNYKFKKTNSNIYVFTEANSLWVSWLMGYDNIVNIISP